MYKFDLKGQKFGRLTVVSYHEDKTKVGTRWNCVCDCGKDAVVTADNLRRGHSKSCGCLVGEMTKKACTTHGKSGAGRTAEYNAWNAMKSRCYNQKCDMFYAYGGRGVVVCEEWKNSFEAFFKDMGERPKGKYSLDRIDTNGNYCKENCRWATNVEQANNKRSNRLLELNGEVHTITYWAKKLNTTDVVIRRRIKRGQPFNYHARKKVFL